MPAGRLSRTVLAMGVATGSFTWAVLPVFGLSAILATSASAFLAIKVFAGR